MMNSRMTVTFAACCLFTACNESHTQSPIPPATPPAAMVAPTPDTPQNQPVFDPKKLPQQTGDGGGEVTQHVVRQDAYGGTGQALPGNPRSHPVAGNAPPIVAGIDSHGMSRPDSAYSGGGVSEETGTKGGSSLYNFNKQSILDRSGGPKKSIDGLGLAGGTNSKLQSLGTGSGHLGAGFNSSAKPGRGGGA